MTTIEVAETVNSLKLGDKLAINDWRAKYTVCGISARYVLAHYGQAYTIISRRPISERGYNHNGVRYGDIVCAPDWWVMGYDKGHDFTNEEWVKEYLADLESDYTSQSVRKQAPVWFISVVGHTDKVYAKRKAPV